MRSALERGEGFQVGVRQWANSRAGAWERSCGKLRVKRHTPYRLRLTLPLGTVLLWLFVAEDPLNEKYASGNDDQSNNDSYRRSHFFDQVEDHSHVLIPFGFLFA